MKKMLLPLLIAALVSPRLPGPAAAAAERQLQQCGGVDIPFPFGIGHGYLETPGSKEQPFNVTCSHRTDSGAPRPKPTPIVDGMEVLHIDVPRGKVHVMSMVSSWCYNATSGSMGDPSLWSYESATFRVSDDDNRLTVVGCNAFAYMWTRDGGADDKYLVGCNATCSRGVRSLADGSCSDSGGCCQAPIRPGLSFNVSFVGYDDSSTAGGIPGLGPASPCIYAMVVDKEAFEFRTKYVTTDELLKAGGSWEVPMVLDWVVGGNQTCEAENRTTYACRSDISKCSNAKNGGPGYTCSCPKGYDGNPYLPGGCKDIDECKAANRTCPAHSICRNTPGGRECYELKLLLEIVGSCIFVVLLGTGMSCAYAIRKKKRLAAMKRQHFKQHGGFLLFEEMKSRQGQGRSFTLFTEEELEDATNKFDERCVLGKGGNGTVYRGTLKDGRAVAIKRCRVAGDERQRWEFGKEMVILSQVNHRNIVKLYGCCLEVEVPMLVYQFIPNGNLHELIHHGGGAPPPPFSLRLKIAREAAEALAYLHSMASPPIIHGDVKSPNILLDENYTVKVSDFGASVLAPADDNSHLVTLVQGTRGYLDPEYMQTCRLTDKSDVYSFGVVLLELLTRRKALAMAAAPEEERSLAAHFLASVRDGRLGGLVDARIKDEVGGEVIETVAVLAKRCLEMSGERRPSMIEVAEELDRIRKVCVIGDGIAILVGDGN
ncbi:putative wall-associated receptor kinase-like 16 [Panicum miliaceum]|uniref:Wall-associated receptor kinase-like 16 n=1 Tax=Panicum miliaceum TaxID=4540 RepID=A0A3L6SXS2_PANMI|nr:putative wall-associated receptor kinase-like 16 [Panicum miliaceum]